MEECLPLNDEDVSSIPIDDKFRLLWCLLIIRFLVPLLSQTSGTNEVAALV